MNTKHVTHQRRSKGKASATVTVTANMTTTIKKDQFWPTKRISINSFFCLEKCNCKIYHATGDADLLIVQKAVQSAVTNKTVLVGEDTDLIVLLCYHANLDSHDLFFHPEPKRNMKKAHVWNIRSTKRHLQQHPVHLCCTWV